MIDSRSGVSTWSMDGMAMERVIEVTLGASKSQRRMIAAKLDQARHPPITANRSAIILTRVSGGGKLCYSYNFSEGDVFSRCSLMGGPQL
jgi:hypothetical protein